MVELPTRTGEDCFADRLERFGERLAVIADDGTFLSYRQLAERADAFSARLGPVPRLLLLEAGNDLDSLIAYLGALRGRHPVILAPAGTSRNDPRIAQTYQPDAVFAADAGRYVLQLEGDTPASAPAGFHPQLAVMLSTSGSTGDPKLVRLSRGNVEANASSIVTYLAIKPGDRAITTLPLHYSYGLSVINSHLLAGATVLLTARSVVDEAFWTFFETHGATCLAGVPYTYELLERCGFEQRALPTLEYLTQAGGRLEPEKVLRYAGWAKARGCRFYLMYGQTEATARMAYLPPEQVRDYPECIGRAIPGGAFHLVDEAGRAIEEAEVTGQLVYRGPNVMMGYACCRADLARGSEVEELWTGDLARRNAAGLYRIVGRVSRFSKIFGLRIGLDEVEQCLARDGLQGKVAGDDECLVIALTSPVPTELAVRLAHRFKIHPAAIRILHVGDFPRLPSGKTDYPAILRMAHREAPDAGYADVGDTPDSQSRCPIHEAYRAAFNGRHIRDKDSFVGLGGDSLSYIQVSSAIEASLGYLPSGWERRPVAELAALAPRKTRFPALTADVVCRVAAILGVVAHHAGVAVVGGGASLLMLLAGYNFVRFQRGKLFAGAVGQAIRPLLLRIILPYYCIILAYQVYQGRLDLPLLLLLDNVVGTGQPYSFLEPYWFMEALLHCTLLIALTFLFPPWRRWVASAPLAAGWVMFAVALVVHLLVLSFGDEVLRTRPAFFNMLYIFALGWCVYFASTLRAKLLVMLAAFVVFPVLWPIPGSRLLWLLAGITLVLWVGRIPLPKSVHRAVAMIGGASFYIYLTHLVPVHWVIHYHRWDSIPLALALSLLCGIAVARVFNWVGAAFVRFVPPRWLGLLGLSPRGE